MFYGRRGGRDKGALSPSALAAGGVPEHPVTCAGGRYSVRTVARQVLVSTLRGNRNHGREERKVSQSKLI